MYFFLNNATPSLNQRFTIKMFNALNILPAKKVKHMIVRIMHLYLAASVATYILYMTVVGTAATITTHIRPRVESRAPAI